MLLKILAQEKAEWSQQITMSCRKGPYGPNPWGKDQVPIADFGTNYRMTEIQAAIGIVQLRKLPRFLETRAQQRYQINQELGKIRENMLPPKLANRSPSWYLYTVRIKMQPSSNGTQ